MTVLDACVGMCEACARTHLLDLIRSSLRIYNNPNKGECLRKCAVLQPFAPESHIKYGVNHCAVVEYERKRPHCLYYSATDRPTLRVIQKERVRGTSPQFIGVHVGKGSPRAVCVTSSLVHAIKWEKYSSFQTPKACPEQSSKSSTAPFSPSLSSFTETHPLPRSSSLFLFLSVRTFTYGFPGHGSTYTPGAFPPSHVSSPSSQPLLACIGVMRLANRYPQGLVQASSTVRKARLNVARAP